jgi:rsbT co-antagonist protein RsbR
MATNETATLAALVSDNEKQILPEWLELQKKTGTLQTGRITEAELNSQSTEFLHLLRDGLAKDGGDMANAAYTPARDFLNNLSRSRALQGFSPTETATFVFSLKQPLFAALTRNKSLSPADLAKATLAITLVLDQLGLFTFDAYQKSREEVILRQQREITELSTPVV